MLTKPNCLFVKLVKTSFFIFCTTKFKHTNKNQFNFRFACNLKLMKMKNKLLLFITFCAINIYSQNNSSIKGIIKDELGALPGAFVVIEGTSLGSTSDFDGNFRINNVPSGKQLIIIKFIGYENKKISIDIQPNKTKNIGVIKLEQSSERLSEVLIKGSNAPSQARALNIKKSSLAIMEVLASDAIGKLPDRNAAEAVQRIQGVSIERDHGEGRYVIVRGTPLTWNATLLNGNRMPSSEGTSNDAGGRTSPLDIFPSEMIQYVQLSKALTPDMEGDAIGGSVNFITKTAPNKRTLNLNIGYGHNDQASKPIQSASIFYGDKTDDGKFGFLVAGSYWNRNWGTDNYEVDYNEDDFALSKLELRDYLGKRTTYGLNVGVEFNINENNKLYARGMYTDFQDDETAVEHIFSFSRKKFTFRRRRGIIGLGLKGGEVGGNFKFNNKFGVDVKLSSYSTKMDVRHLPKTVRTAEPVYQMVMFSMPMTYNGLASNGNKYLDIDATDGYTGDNFANIQPNPVQTISSNKLLLEMLYGFVAGSYERDLNSQIDFYYDANENLKLKTGYKYKQKELERGAPAYINVNMPSRGFGVDLKLSDLKTIPFPANGGYLAEIGNPYNSLLQNPMSFSELDRLFGEEFQKNKFFNIKNDVKNPSSAPGFFKGDEVTKAAYIMGEYSFSNELKMIGGVRYENVKIEYDGHSVITKKEGGKTVQSVIKVNNSNSFDAFLPMLHFKYSPKENLNLRVAYTRTYARANFTDLNPTESKNLIFNTISKGNINLKPTYSNNFDAMGEYYFDNIGIVSGGIFYKDLSNVIYKTRTIQSIDGVRFDVNQPENSESGSLLGFEIGFSRRFGEKAGFLEGFGLEGNYTFTDSKMNVPEYSLDGSKNIIVKTTEQKLPNQSANIFNAGLFFENSKISAKLAANYKGKSLAVIQGNSKNYRWYDKNFTLDFSASYNVTDKIRVYAEINNLTNEPLRYYHGVKNRPEQIEYYSLRGMLGINYKLF